MKLAALILLCCGIALAQTTTPALLSGPSYFTTTGIRASYYDYTLTETTNIGARITSSSTPGIPAGAWAVLSIDASPRSQATSAAARIGIRYFLKSAASDNLIFHTEAGAGLASVPLNATTSALQANIQPGVGVVWRVCHTFLPKTSVNCILDFDYELNWINSQAVRPLIGLYGGLTF
jgi:hypothetical protein